MVDTEANEEERKNRRSFFHLHGLQESPSLIFFLNE